MNQHFCTLNVKEWNGFILKDTGKDPSINISRYDYLYLGNIFVVVIKMLIMRKISWKWVLKKKPLLDIVKCLFVFPFLSHFNSSFVFSLKKKIVDYYLLIYFLLRKVKEMRLKLHLNFAGAEFLLNFLFMINIILLACPSIITKAMHILA